MLNNIANKILVKDFYRMKHRRKHSRVKSGFYMVYSGNGIGGIDKKIFDTGLKINIFVRNIEEG